MIDPNWRLDDLDPRTWRNIGRFFMPSQYIAANQPGEHGLYVLHEAGERPRVVDDQLGPRPDIKIDRVEDPRNLALELHERAEWDRVHVIDRRHLQHVAREAQISPRRELTLDAYYHLVYQLMWDGSDGYVCVPEKPAPRYGWTYSDLLRFARSLPSPSTVGLFVLNGAELDIGLVLQFENGKITRVTTHEGLPELPPAALDQHYLDALCDAMTRTVAPVAAALLCTPDVFETWLDTSDKTSVLHEAARARRAFWRS